MGENRPVVATETAVERLPMVVLLLVNPLLLMPVFADFALARWLLVACSFVVAGVVSRRLRQGITDRWREIWPVGALCALVCWHLLRGAPVAEGSRWLILLLLGALTYGYCRVLGPSGRERSLELMVMAGGGIGTYAVFQAFGWDVVQYPAESWMYRVVTTFGHRNFTAAFLVMTVFAALALAEMPGSHRRRPSFFLWPILAGLLATGSRFPILAAMVAVATYFLRGRRSRKVVVVLLVVVLISGAVIVMGNGAGEVVSRLETIRLRGELYRSMFPLVIDNPVVGGGPGRFARGIPELVGPNTPDQDANLVFLHAHMLPAELLIELGLLGLVLAAFFVMPIYAALCRRGFSSWSYLVWGHLCWLVINLYDVSCFTYAGWICLWPFLAFIRSDLEQKTPNAETVQARWWSWGPVFVALVCAAALLPMAWSSHVCFVASGAHNAGKSTTAAKLFESASESWPLSLDQRYREANATLDAGRLGDAVRRLSVVEAEAPAFSSVRHLLAMAYARLEMYEQALLWIDRHLQAHPGDLEAVEDRERLLRRLSP